MKTTDAARKAAFIGAGAGLVLFAVVGLLPGSFIGGVIGVNIAGGIFGTPLSSALLPRVIVGVSMLLGIFLSALIFSNRFERCWLAYGACDWFHDGEQDHSGRDKALIRRY